MKARFSLIPKRVARLCVAGAIASLLSLASWPALAEWEITKFQVYQGTPAETLENFEGESLAQSLDIMTSPGWEWRENGEETPKLSRSMVEEIEAFLEDAAREYSRMGFPDPYPLGGFDSVVTLENEEKAIRVYVYDNLNVSPGVLAGYHTPAPCNAPFARNYIYLNTVTFGKGGVIHDQDYVSMAHELFHAVQAATSFFISFHKLPPRNGTGNTCARGNWLKEGTADAMGLYLARNLKGVDFDENMKPWGQKEALKVLGARRYSEPLNEPSNGDGDYLSSSFWRHLAEESYIGMHGNQKSRNGSWPIPENYQYLVDFFAGEYSYDSSVAGEIDWLNGVMKKHPHIRASLARVYSEFVAAFADHVNTRVNETKKRLSITPLSTLQGWLGQVMKGCEDAGYFGTDTGTQVRIKMAPNSAKCVTAAAPAGPGMTGGAVEITAIHNDEEQLKQMRIGLVDGSLVSAPTIHSVMGNSPPYIARWTFPFFRSNGDTFIVSNMSLQPGRTKALDVELFFASLHWDSSMWQGPLPPPPQPPPPGPPPPKREQEKQRLKSAVADPVKHLSPIGKVERKSWRRPCDPTRSKYNLCSARMVITLSYTPWAQTDNVLAKTFAVSNVFADSESNSTFDLNVARAQFEAGRDTEKFLESVDASEIRIELPKTEYGFSGAISNASIEVSKAGRGDYLSYGPTVYVGEDSFHRPPNGQVVIEEYTERVLRGRFSAGLVDTENPGPDSAPIVAREVTGSFIIPSPFLLDKDFVLDEEQIKQELIQNMMQNSPFGTAVIDSIIQSTGGAPPQILCDEGVGEEFIEAMGFTSGCEGRSGGGQIAKACSCECELREEEQIRPECEKSCRAEWRQCPLPEEVASSSLDEQIEFCRMALLRKGIPEGQIPLFLEQLREVPEIIREDTFKTLCQ